MEYYFDFFFTVSSMILVGVARGYQIVMDCQDKWPYCWPLFPIVTVTTAPLQTIFRQSLNILLSSLKQNPSLDVEPWPGPITAEIEVGRQIGVVTDRRTKNWAEPFCDRKVELTHWTDNMEVYMNHFIPKVIGCRNYLKFFSSVLYIFLATCRNVFRLGAVILSTPVSVRKKVI